MVFIEVGGIAKLAPDVAPHSANFKLVTHSSSLLDYCQRTMAGRGGGSSARTEGGAGQQHQGWNERSSASSSSADVGGRSPLKEAPAGNRKKGNATSKSRPHDVPHARNARGTTAGAGKEDKGITLRCGLKFKEQRTAGQVTHRNKPNWQLTVCIRSLCMVGLGARIRARLEGCQ